MIHDLCQAYPGMTPAAISKMSVDEVYALAWSRERLLAATGERVTGTSGELAKMGMLPEGYKRGKSVARELMEQAEEEQKEMITLEALLPTLKGRARRGARRRLAALQAKHGGDK